MGLKLVILALDVGLGRQQQHGGTPSCCQDVKQSEANPAEGYQDEN